MDPHHDADARIISQPNGGLCSARNTGLEYITNRWVNFCDPDDTVPADYFEIVGRFLASDEAERVHLVASNLHILDDATGEIRNDHPLRFKFAEGNRVVDLERHPQYIHLQAASAFYRRDLIEAERLGSTTSFSPTSRTATSPRCTSPPRSTRAWRCSPTPTTTTATVTTAAHSSRPAGAHADKYTESPATAICGCSSSVHDRRGHVPIWAQNLVLYDLLWYFKQDERVHSVIGAIPRDVTTEFHDIVRQIMKYIDVETIEDYRLTPMSTAVAQCPHDRCQGRTAAPERRPYRAGRRRQADRRGPVLLRRRAAGRAVPRLVATACEPVHAKIRSITYLGERMASERIVWLPATGTLEVALDGRRKPLALRPARPRRYSVPAADMWHNLAGQAAPLVGSTDEPSCRR